MTTNKYYNRLKEIKDSNPELTFSNKGYETLSREIQDKHKAVIAEIGEILKETVEGFVEFNNFKPRKSGSFAVRCQYVWSKSPYFVGVGYFDIEDFKDFELPDKFYLVQHNELKYTGKTFFDCQKKLQEVQGQSYHWATTYEGWKILNEEEFNNLKTQSNEV